MLTFKNGMNIDCSIVNADTPILNKFRNSVGIEEISGLINSLLFISSSQILERDWNNWFELLNFWVETWEKEKKIYVLFI